MEQRFFLVLRDYLRLSGYYSDYYWEDTAAIRC